MCVNIYIYMCVCVYVRACVCVCARARIYIYIYRERERERQTDRQTDRQRTKYCKFLYRDGLSLSLRPRLALTSVICLQRPYFYTLLHKGTFWKKLLNIKCEFWFSLLSLSESFTVRRSEQDIIINEHMSSCKVTVITFRFTLKLNFHNRFLTNFQENSQEFVFKTSVKLEPSCSMLTNGPTDKQTWRTK